MANIFSNAAGDGQTLKDNASFSTARSAGVADSVDNTSGFGPFVEVSQNTSVSGQYRIVRGHLTFDLSSIPVATVVTSASVRIYVSSGLDQDNDGKDYIGLVGSSQDDPENLVVEDFDENNNTLYSNDVIELTGNGGG